MTAALFIEQLLNGVQFGVMLFLIASGLTLVFGIMNFINLAHGALYMSGAFAAAVTQRLTGSFLVAIIVGMIVAAAVVMVVLGVVVTVMVAVGV